METAVLSELTNQTNNLKGLRNTLQTEVGFAQTQIRELAPEVDKNSILLNEIQKVREHNENILTENTKVLKKTEKNLKEFIENPLSIGHYATLLKKKHNIDIIKMLQ